DAPEVSGFSRTVNTQHQHVESEIGKGYGSTSLKSELASMKARFVVESGDWPSMKGQGTFDNIDELFALGVASVKLGDAGGAEAAAAVPQFRSALARTPRRARSLLGLARAAQKAGQHAAAVDAAKAFLAAWHLADPDRPELAEARALAR